MPARKKATSALQASRCGCSVGQGSCCSRPSLSSRKSLMLTSLLDFLQDPDVRRKEVLGQGKGSLANTITDVAEKDADALLRSFHGADCILEVCMRAGRRS